MQLDDKHTYAKITSQQIEAVLHASVAPVPANTLKKWLGLSQTELDHALLILKERLESSAICLACTAEGYRLQIDTRFSPLIAKLFPEQQEKLSQALLETLAVIAYRQPVTRGDIEQIRGVAPSSQVLRQLFDKGWIKEDGHKDTLGSPSLLWTTKRFLTAFGLSSLEDLPPMTDTTP